MEIFILIDRELLGQKGLWIFFHSKSLSVLCVATTVCRCTARKSRLFLFPFFSGFLALSRVECCTNSDSESISTPPGLSLSCWQASCLQSTHSFLYHFPGRKRDVSAGTRSKRERGKKNRNGRSQTGTELLFCDHFKESSKDKCQ